MSHKNFEQQQQQILTLIFWRLEMCELNHDISHFNFIAQGKTTIPGVDDAEELRLTDVCYPASPFYCCIFVK